MSSLVSSVVNHASTLFQSTNISIWGNWNSPSNWFSSSILTPIPSAGITFGPCHSPLKFYSNFWVHLKTPYPCPTRLDLTHANSLTVLEHICLVSIPLGDQALLQLQDFHTGPSLCLQRSLTPKSPNSWLLVIFQSQKWPSSIGLPDSDHPI